MKEALGRLKVKWRAVKVDYEIIEKHGEMISTVEIGELKENKSNKFIFAKYPDAKYVIADRYADESICIDEYYFYSEQPSITDYNFQKNK